MHVIEGQAGQINYASLIFYSLTFNNILNIIVMLILVAVTISMAINGGLFDYAGKATGDTKNAINAEQELANGRVQIGGTWYDSIDDYLNKKPSTNQGDGTTGGEEGEDIIGVDGEVFTAIYTETKDYTDANGDTAVIPKGFSVGKSDGINTIDNGLVIQDKDGNQFVWIPVEVTDTDTETSIASFYRSAWSSNERTTWLSTSYTEPYASGYTEEAAEYNAMLKSVYENGGFYIGRYEAGSITARTKTANGTTQMVVKRDAYPYTYVGWGLTMSDYTSDVTDQNSLNQGKGALALSKAMYEGEDVGATSTLCYGVMWDAMLEFIKDDTHNVTTSTTWGNYYDNPWTITRTSAKYAVLNTTTYELEDWVEVSTEGKSKTSSESILLTTGADDSFAAKNIFDVAGNCNEWTNEAGSSALRVVRGGYYDDVGSFYPASNRSYGGRPYSCGSSLGFRPTLYITNNT